MADKRYKVWVGASEDQMRADVERDEYGVCTRPAVFLKQSAAKRRYQDVRPAVLIVKSKPKRKRRKKT